VRASVHRQSGSFFIAGIGQAYLKHADACATAMTAVKTNGSDLLTSRGLLEKDSLKKRERTLSGNFNFKVVLLRCYFF
jgi:hypothetical protein